MCGHTMKPPRRPPQQKRNPMKRRDGDDGSEHPHRERHFSATRGTDARALLISAYPPHFRRRKIVDSMRMANTGALLGVSEEVKGPWFEAA
jgi:hypothetical protein